MAAANAAKEPLALARLDGWTAALLPMLGAVSGSAGAALFLVFPAETAAPLAVALWTGLDRIRVWRLLMLAVGGLLRWQALVHWFNPGDFAAMVASQAVPPAAMIVLAFVARPAGEGAALPRSSGLRTWPALAAVVFGVATAMATGLKPALGIATGCLLILRVAQILCYHRWGGVNGTGLALTQFAVEAWILALFACADCIA